MGKATGNMVIERDIHGVPESVIYINGIFMEYEWELNGDSWIFMKYSWVSDGSKPCQLRLILDT